MVTGQMEWQPRSSVLPLAAGEAHVWLVEIGRFASVASLSATERSRAERFVRGDIRNRFVAAHAALREILAGYCPCAPASLCIETHGRGKPFLPEYPAVRFNLSHSGNRALVAVARDGEIGVDIEEVRDGVRIVELAQRFLAPDEAAHLARLGPPEDTDMFFRYWTCKEAFVKALGRGFDLSLRSFTVALDACGARLEATDFEPQAVERWILGELSPCAGHRAAVCLEAGWRIGGCWRWEYDQESAPPL